MGARATAALAAALVLGGVLAGACIAGTNIRVLVMDDVERVEMRFPGSYDVRDMTGMGVVTATAGGGGVISLGPGTQVGPGVRVRAEDSVVGINEFALTGTVDVRRNASGRFRIINELDIEDYTRAVVGEEMGPNWPIEALKAQAVAVRTYALYRMQSTAAEDYDLCATVNSQMFTGDAWLKEGPALAAQATRGAVMTYRGALAETLFHGSCGGMTEDAADVWEKGCGYLKPASCDCNSISPNARWERLVGRAELEEALAAAGHSAEGVSRVSVSRRSLSGRAALVRVTHPGGTLSLKGNEFRKALGYKRLPSTFFNVEATKDGFVFRGSGSGHGVGLCQWGARAMAEQGSTYEQILAHYYPALEMSRAGYGPDGGGKDGG